MEYRDTSKEKVLTKKDLNGMVWRSLLLQASFNYERMQAGGWLYSILPGLKKIHKNKEDFDIFFNCGNYNYCIGNYSIYKKNFC